MNTNRQRPIPRPRPDLLRRPTGGFGWLDQALLLEGWLAQIGPNGIAVLVLLALAADRHGASFFSRHKMADSLGCSLAHVDEALQRLCHLSLVAFSPWRKNGRDGVWQLLPLPQSRQNRPRDGRSLGIAQILAALGFASPENVAEQPRRKTSPTDGAE